MRWPARLARGGIAASVVLAAALGTATTAWAAPGTDGSTGAHARSAPSAGGTAHAGRAGVPAANAGTASKGATTKGTAAKGTASKGAAAKGATSKGGAAATGTASKGAAAKGATSKNAATTGAGARGVPAGRASGHATAVSPEVISGVTIVSAVPGDQSIAVTWSIAGDTTNVDHYAVSAAPGPVACNPVPTPPTLTCTISGLTNGTAYTVTVAAQDASNVTLVSDTSGQVTPSAPPGAPTGVSAVAGNAQATVSWTAPTSTGSGVDHYTVTSTPGSLTCTTVGPTATSCVVNTLVNGTPYTFTVVANGTYGADSAASSPSASVTPGPPGAPTAVLAVAGANSASVSWSAPLTVNAGITSYTVTSSPGNLTCSSANPTVRTCTVSGLTSGQAYTFTVVASGPGGDSSSSLASAPVTPGPPDAPTNVQVAQTNGVASVSWTAPVNVGAGIAYYTATAQPGGAYCTTNGTTCTISGLTTGQAYTFTVVATGQAGTGDSAGSQPGNATIGVPGAPTQVLADPRPTGVRVSWTPPVNTGAGITGYTVTASPGGATCTAGSNATECTVTGLTSGLQYTFTVVANSSAGASAASAPSASVAPGPPDAPTNVTGAPGDTTVTVYWKAPVNVGAGIAGYTVTANPGGATCSSPDVSTTSCEVPGLTNGTGYTFTVVAHGIGASGDSVASAASPTISPQRGPSAPTGVTLTPTDMGLVVSWTASSSAGAGIAYYAAVATPGGQFCVTPNGDATTCTINGVTPGEMYTVTVVAVGVNGVQSMPSDASDQATPFGPPMSGPLVRNADGRLMMFARGADNHLYYNIQRVSGPNTRDIPTNTSDWVGWTSLGGQLTSNPVVYRAGDGRLFVFVFGADGSLWYKAQTAPGVLTFSTNYIGLGGYQIRPTSISVVAQADGRLAVFGWGKDFAIWYTTQNTPGSDTWSGFVSLHGILAAAPIVTLNPDGRIDVYARAFDAAVWHDTQVSPSGDTWTGWITLGTGPIAGVG